MKQKNAIMGMAFFRAGTGTAHAVLISAIATDIGIQFYRLLCIES